MKRTQMLLSLLALSVVCGAGCSLGDLRASEQARRNRLQAQQQGSEQRDQALETARIALEAKRFEDAAKAYTQAIESGAKSAQVYRERGWTYKQLKVWDKAQADLERSIREQPPDNWGFVHLGALHGTLGRNDQALAVLSEGAKLFPDHFSIAYQYAIALKRADDPAASEREILRAVEISKLRGNTDRSRDVRLLKKLSEVRARQGKFDLAIGDIDVALKENPDDAHLHLLRTIWHLGLGHGAESAADAEAYLFRSEWKGAWAAGVIYGHFGYRMAGNEAAATSLLAQAEAKKDLAKWPGPLIKFLRGELNADEVLASAANADTRASVQAVVGTDAVVRGQAERGRVLLAQARERNAMPSQAYQWWLADGQLRRMEHLSSAARSLRIKRLAVVPTTTQPGGELRFGVDYAAPQVAVTVEEQWQLYSNGVAVFPTPQVQRFQLNKISRTNSFELQVPMEAQPGSYTMELVVSVVGVEAEVAAPPKVTVAFEVQ